MALFFIVGIAGTGKSTIQGILQSRGYEAYDTDGREFGMAQWHNDTTGYIHPKSSVKSKDRTEEFLKSHSWIVPEASVKKLVDHASGKRTVFLCGDVANELEISKHCAATFVLDIDAETLQHRLRTRSNNDWGKQPHELQMTLKKREMARTRYEDRGYIVIDATRPAERVADDILDKVQDILSNDK